MPDVLYGDQIRLKQILINLISNALKFTQIGEVRVVINYAEDDQLLHVSVIDTGVGIDKEELRKLFVKFNKLERTLRENEDGLGIGLTIC